MKITMYELLGMIKDGKAPKTIKSEGHYYGYNEMEKDYYEGMGYDYEYLFKNTPNDRLNDEVEIIEEDKKIEKLDIIPYEKCIHDVTHKEKEILLQIRKTQIKFNELIDKVNSLENKQ